MLPNEVFLKKLEGEIIVPGFNPYLDALRAILIDRDFSGLTEWELSLFRPKRHLDSTVLAYEATVILRPRLISEYALAIPTRDVLRYITDCGPVVEIGAGNGYWAHLIRQLGGDIIPIELDPPETGRNNHAFTKSWTDMVEGDHDSLGEYIDRVLFLCWPTPSLANTVARKFIETGISDFIYIGEGPDSATADVEFFKLLNEHCIGVRELQVCSYPGINDSLLHIRRK